ncbi:MULTISPECIES: sodium/glutamate symporter [Corynebacterium]|uniref:sodium/glutamate symporter n=1 Tax=Corynebacterium TaxID=1716 RepID=UPI00069DE7D0|nr:MULTISPECIES: sodium/glutamate symporter [Corynebacterium]ASE56446.1 sodium:glutamate symporter [Corynebacterium jeikeium]MBC6769360.1 sodium:glutamate symporter [Corynebacterium sp. LK15]MBC6793701.1 sodium:glutamate symporter [Corynebacterium sp. LK26]KAA0884531.1 sodium:glutamate symporter [Corynebacterium amycolatum]KAA9220062.1 sodium:glutamate symporter [Corynebacterium amycolatum]
MDGYTPFDVLMDIGWISLLLIIGNLMRRFIPWFQKLLIPAPITAGLLGLLLGPNALGIIQFSEHFGDYATILIAAVFGALPFTMDFDAKVRQRARTMWSYSVGMYLAQWGFFALLGVILFAPLFNTPDWFGIMLPVGFVGGFGVAAAVGGALDSAGTEATSLGFTAAAVGMFSAIVGGVIFARWGSKKGHTNELPALDKLPEDMRTGIISLPGQRPSVGRATTSPSSIEPIALHVAALAGTLFLANILTNLVNDAFPALSFPLFAMAFLVGLAGVGVLHLIKAPHYLDTKLMGSVSGASTDFLVAVGIASIVPAVVATYIVPLIILFVVGLAFCLVLFFYVAPRVFEHGWFERAVFSWGWATASVATGIAVLKIVDPEQKSGTLEEFGMAYVGFAPFEIAAAILAPIAIIAGLVWLFGGVALIGGLALLIPPMIWLKKSKARAL